MIGSKHFFILFILSACLLAHACQQRGEHVAQVLVLGNEQGLGLVVDDKDDAARGCLPPNCCKPPMAEARAAVSEPTAR